MATHNRRQKFKCYSIGCNNHVQWVIVEVPKLRDRYDTRKVNRELVCNECKTKVKESSKKDTDKMWTHYYFVLRETNFGHFSDPGAPVEQIE